MARSTKKTYMLAKLETTPGTDAAPTGSADAVLLRVEDLNLGVEQLFATREIIQAGFTSPDQLPFTRRASFTFSVDAASAGAAGTAPQWGDLLQACGMAETITAGSYVVYNDISAALKNLTIWAEKDGLLFKIGYCAGNVTADFTTGNVPRFTFAMQGLVYSIAAGTIGAETLTAWQRPEAVGPAYTSKLILGGTYATGAITGGTQYNFKNLSFDLGNDVQFDTLVQQETCGIYGRNVSLQAVLDLGASGEATQWANMAAGTQISVGFTHGTVGGKQITVFLGKASITGIADNVDGNKLLSQLTFTGLPTVADDTIRIIAK